MKNDKPSPDSSHPLGSLPGTPGSPVAPRIPALFRGIDWFTFLLTFAAVWIGYFFTLAPEITKEL